MTSRIFLPGSEWLYFKVYTGPAFSDEILVNILHPLLKSYISNDQVRKWFFIRFSDPEYHIRLRLLLSSEKDLKRIITDVSEALNPLVSENIIWKIQIDTYFREIERYGAGTIELSETLFFDDSNSILELISSVRSTGIDKLRWLNALEWTNLFLEKFGLNLVERMLFMEKLKVGFGEEFNMNKKLKLQLDKKYREHSDEIWRFLEKEEDYFLGTHEVKVNSNDFSKIAQDIELILKYYRQNGNYEDLERLLSSHIHMHMNRAFRSKNRLHEMVCYDFLFRFYRSKNARLKNKMAE